MPGLGRKQLRRKIALDLTRTPGSRLWGLALVNRNVAQLMEEQLNPLTARPLPGLALRLLVHQLTPDSHEALLELQQFPGQRQTPPDHPAAGEASPWSASPAAGALGAENEALAEASSSPTVAELPPLSAEGLLGLLEQHSPAVVAQQLLQHEQQGDEMAMLLVRALGESHDDTLVAGIQNLQWLPGWGQVFHWLLDHAEARQALTVAVRQGLMAPAVPAGEAPRSDDPTTPTTPASPTPVLPGQRLRVDGPFLRQVRHAMNCTQPTFAMIFGVRPRTVQYWEVGRHRMGLRCEVRLQQILTDPVGAPHFRQLGLVLEFQDPDPSEPPPDGEPAPPSPPQPGLSGLEGIWSGLRRLLRGHHAA